MARSIKKGPFVDLHLRKKEQEAQETNNRTPIKDLVASFDGSP